MRGVVGFLLDVRSSFLSDVFHQVERVPKNQIHCEDTFGNFHLTSLLIFTFVQNAVLVKKVLDLRLSDISNPKVFIRIGKKLGEKIEQKTLKMRGSRFIKCPHLYVLPNWNSYVISACNP